MYHMNGERSPIIPVWLQNKVIIEALIDTGATNSSVSPKVIYSDLRDEEVKLQPLRTTITVADGGTLRANEVAQIEVAVVENCPVIHDFCMVIFAGQDMILEYKRRQREIVCHEERRKKFSADDRRQLGVGIRQNAEDSM